MRFNIVKEILKKAKPEIGNEPLYMAFIEPIVTAPDLTTGKIKDKLETHYETTHPFAELDSAETRGRYRRRVGGAAVGAVGGFFGGRTGTPGVIGAVLGAGYGAYAAKKGKGQTKDYVSTAVVSYGIGSIVNSVFTFLGGSITWSSVYTLVQSLGKNMSAFLDWLGLVNNVTAALAKKPKADTTDTGVAWMYPDVQGGYGVDNTGDVYPLNDVAKGKNWGRVVFIGAMIFLANGVL